MHANLHPSCSTFVSHTTIFDNVVTALKDIDASVKNTYAIEPNEIIKEFMAFEGRLVFRGGIDYEKFRVGHSLAPDLPFPLIIAYCISTTDVAICLSFARKYRSTINFTCRSGGHSNAAYSLSDGIVIDVSPMKDIQLSNSKRHVVVESGVCLGDLNSTLEEFGLHIPGGECPSVGVAGHSMGGGYGFTSRSFGLNCDHMERVWMMLADGRIVVADNSQNSDLFWAVRGGTGNTFGVLLKIQYRTVELPKIWGFVITWPIDEAPKILADLQNKYIRGETQLPLEMGFQCAISRIQKQKNLSFFMIGTYLGSRSDGLKLLEPLGGTLLQDKVETYNNLNDFLLNWWELPELTGLKEVKRSNYIARQLTENEWTTIVDFYKTTPNQYNMVAFEVYGGKASAKVDNAFIHRDVDFNIFIDSFSKDTWQNCTEEIAEKWIADYDDLIANYANGHRYQNYPHRNNPNYRWNYWGDAFPSLLFVKKKYDPTFFFSFAQGITDYPDDNTIARSSALIKFNDLIIKYEVEHNDSVTD